MIEQRLVEIHADITSAVQAVLEAAFGGGDVSAAYAEQMRLESERLRLEAEYEAAQQYYEARWEGML